MPPAKRRCPDPDPDEWVWEQHRPTFLRLYQTERKTLKEVKEIMESEHGFPVNSLLTYETKLRDELHLRKKLKKTDWVSVHHHRLKRGDKPTGVYLNGTEIPQHKVWKEIRRSGARSADNSQYIPLPRDIVVRTPSPIGHHVLHVSSTRQEKPQSLSPQVLASSVTMLSVPSSPGVFISSPQNTTWPSQSHVDSSMNYEAQGGKLAKLLETSSGSTATALFSIPWVTFSNSIRQIATALYRPSAYSRVLDHPLNFESLPFTIYSESELASPKTWGIESSLHSLAIPSHTPSSSAPTLNMDILYLLSKVFYLISNNKLEDIRAPFTECPSVIQLILDRIPQVGLKSLFLEDLPTIRAAWQYLTTCAGKYGYRDTFIYLMRIGLLHRDWVVPNGASYLSFAASMDALDVIRSLSGAGIRADGNIGYYPNPAIVEAAATRNLECMELLLATCDVNCEVRESTWDGEQISIFGEFFSALARGNISTSLKRDHAYPPNYFKETKNNIILVQFSLEDELQSQALDMLLQSGANVDTTYRYESDGILLNQILREKCPKEYLPTILEQSYYISIKLFYKLAPYSTQTTRLFFRPDICLAAKQGYEFLRKCWTSQPAQPGSNGTKLLELVFAEQFLVRYRDTDIDIVKSLLELGIGPDLTSLQLGSGYFLWRIVTHASTDGYDERFAPIFKALVQSGAVIDSGVLEAAVEEEGVGILKFLRESGANVSKHGVLALSTAARLGNYEAVSWLLEVGADINAVTMIESSTPHIGYESWSVIALASAAWRPHRIEQLPEGIYGMQDTDPASFEMIDYLIDHGAELKTGPHDLNAAKFLRRLFIYAWNHDFVDTILLDQMTFFVSKLDHHDLSSLEVCLLNDCATLPSNIGDFSTAEQLKTSLFELFRSHGAPMPNGDILAYLIYNRSLPWLIQEFLKECTDIDRYYTGDIIEFQYTPVQAAAYRGDRDLFEQLVKMGANINMPAYEVRGMTALQAAASQGHMALVERLVRMGANINAPGGRREGVTALQAACGLNAKSATERENMIKVIQFLIMEGADVNAPAGIGDLYHAGTALQIAAREGDMEMALLLIQMGADINIFSQTMHRGQCSALDIAALFGRLDMVQFLLSLGGLSRYRGRTGYDGAIQAAESEKHFVIADLIRQHYAEDCKLLGTNIARTFLEEESLLEERFSEKELIG